jgi:MFS family permease
MTAATGSIRSALRHRDFRRLLIALAVSQAGDWLYNVAYLALVFERTHSATWVSVATAARVLPIVLLSPLGGMIADRYDRQRTMISSDLVRAIAMLALTIVALLGLPVVLALLLAAVTTAAASPYPPCAAATTSRLVPDADLPGANAARSVVGPLCIVLGPALGGLLLLLGGPVAALAANTATFVISAIVVATIPGGAVFKPASVEPVDGLWQEMTVGAVALWQHPAAMRLVGADMTGSLVYGMQTVLFILLSSKLGWADHGYGVLLAAAGAGGVIGTVLIGRIGRIVRPQRVLGVALLAQGCAMTVTAFSPTIAGVLVLALLGGMGATIVEVMTETGLQRELDEAFLARAYGFAFPAAIAGIVLGSLLAAPLVAAVGLTGALVLPGIAVCVHAAVLLRSVRPRTMDLASGSDGELASFEPQPAAR